jgi:hypothetical protein
LPRRNFHPPCAPRVHRLYFTAVWLFFHTSILLPSLSRPDVIAIRLRDKPREKGAGFPNEEASSNEKLLLGGENS